MSINDIEKLRGRKAGLILQEHCRKSAVIIPIIETDDGPRLLFEVRSSKVGRQPGDICFPGGKLQEYEEPVHAAIREACEELLIKPDQLDIICPADVFHKTSALIYPFAAYLSGYTGTYSASEVAEVFTVPLSFFMETEPFVYDDEISVVKKGDFPYHLIVGGENYKWPGYIDKVLFYNYNGRIIWGITARIIRGFVNTIKGL